MSLKLTDQPKKKSNIPVLEVGTYPARIVGIVGVGKHPQEYNGEVKPPKDELRVFYELLDEFLKNSEGEDDETKPRWFNEKFPLNSNTNDKAKSTVRYTALDPTLTYNWDYSKLISTPCMVTIAVTEGKGLNKGRQFNKITAVSSMRPKEATKAKDLVNPSFVFDFYEPDPDSWEIIPDFIKDEIKSALNYEGSKVESLVQSGGIALEEKEVDDEDSNW